MVDFNCLSGLNLAYCFQLCHHRVQFGSFGVGIITGGGSTTLYKVEPWNVEGENKSTAVFYGLYTLVNHKTTSQNVKWNHEP